VPLVVRPARPDDLRAVSRLAAELVRLHHRLDPPRFLLVEPIEDGYQWFFSRELERDGALILVAEDAPDEKDETGETGETGGRGSAPVSSAAHILGYAYGTLEPRNWNDLLDACGKLNDLYVDAAGRRRGTGRALCEAMFAALRARGAPRVVLLSAWRNPEAHAFFESLGFRRTMLEMTAEL
jgi:ribosomal protein S18 acetylase RimI-like enzyme